MNARIERPGIPEVLVGAIVYGVMYRFVPPILIAQFPDDTQVGLALSLLSAVMGLVAFAAAWAIRIRRLAPFGIRRPATKWFLIAILFGLVAIILTRLLFFVVSLLAPTLLGNVQGDYQAAASAGGGTLALQLLFIAVLTPIGEELAFRGVLTNALGRFGPWVAVPVSAILFAVVHGINSALIPAIVVGVIAAILFLRSRSVWPGVIVHAINNAAATLLPLLVTAQS